MAFPTSREEGERERKRERKGGEGRERGETEEGREGGDILVAVAPPLRQSALMGTYIAGGTLVCAATRFQQVFIPPRRSERDRHENEGLECHAWVAVLTSLCFRPDFPVALFWKEWHNVSIVLLGQGALSSRTSHVDTTGWLFKTSHHSLDINTSANFYILSPCVAGRFTHNVVAKTLSSTSSETKTLGLYCAGKFWVTPSSVQPGLAIEWC